MIILAGSPRLEGGDPNTRMSKQEPTSPVVLRPRAAGTTLHSWLYDEIRGAILERRLSPGSRLPSRKALALQYHVSVTTVVAVSERLVEHGYLDARVGSGTYVRGAFSGAPADAPAGMPAQAPAQNSGLRAPPAARLRRKGLSDRGRLLAAHALPKVWSNHSAATFGLSRPALDAFAIDTWNHLAEERLRCERSVDRLAHGEPLGFPPLRQALADHVRRTRGIRCDAEQVVITSGTQHSLDLVARLLLDPGDPVWMEDPGYAPVTSLLRSHGIKVVGVPVDDRGIDCGAGRRKCLHARLAYVTPGCQFPLGVAMSHARRCRLLQWAIEAGAWIFEDDCGSQLRADGRPQALHSLDRAGSVIYSNSFNGMLFPSLRLGFMILPQAFIAPVATALSITQRYQPTAEQAALTDFIVLGHFDQHVRRMRELYAERRDALVKAAGAELGDLMRIGDSRPGRQVIGWLSPSLDEAQAWRRAAARQVDSVALTSLTIERSLPPGLVFGIGAADARAIRTAIRRLGRVLRVLAWEAKGAKPSQEKVPAGGADEPSVQTRYPPQRRPRLEPRDSATAHAQGAPLGSAHFPRYR
jgi:GntR family transcriptional regulator / MocR family aminotransferase